MTTKANNKQIQKKRIKKAVNEFKEKESLNPIKVLKRLFTKNE